VRTAQGRRLGISPLARLLLGVTMLGLACSGQAPTLRVQEQRGQAAYEANCAGCHGGPDGGGMMDYPPRHNANGHTWHHADCELAQVIRDGASPMTEMMRSMMAPPDAPRMPAFGDRLSDEEIEAVLAYIKTLWTPRQRDFQARATREVCS